MSFQKQETQRLNPLLESTDTIDLGEYGKRHLERIQQRFDENIVEPEAKKLVAKRLAASMSPEQRETYRTIEETLRNHPIAGQWFESGQQEHLWARQVTLEVCAHVPNKIDEMVSVMNKHLQHPQAVQAIGVLQRDYDAELLRLMNNTEDIDSKLPQAVGPQGVESIRALFASFTEPEKVAVREWQDALYTDGKSEKPKTQEEAIVALLKLILELIQEFQKEQKKAEKKEKKDDKKEKKNNKEETTAELEEKKLKTEKKIEANKKEYETTKKDLDTAEERHVSLIGEKRDLLGKIYALEDGSPEQVTLQKKLDSVKKSIKEAEKKIVDLEKEMKDVKKEGSDLKKRLASLEDRLNNIKEEQDDENADSIDEENK